MKTSQTKKPRLAGLLVALSKLSAEPHDYDKCLFLLAEEVGFEPTNGCPLPVFKTGAFNRSATLPTTNFKTAALNHSATLPLRDLRFDPRTGIGKAASF
jgi:hypothetical protein